MGCCCRPDITAAFTFADDGSPFITTWRAERPNQLVLLRETLGSGECDWPIAAIIAASPRVPHTAAPAASPPVSSFPSFPIHGWNYLFVSPCWFFCCVSSLCPFSNTEKTFPVCWIIEVKLLANSKSGSAPLKIYLAVLTMNIIKAASCGPPKTKRTEEPSHSCFRATVLLSLLHLSSLSPF